MAYKYQGDATLGVSLNVNTPKPLDIRAVVNSTQDLYSIPESTAYIGMTVANVADGNIYMLIDKSKIGEKSGWKASYESIQIITCTAEEYKTWLDNTNIDGEMFSPKDETIPFIHSNTYYYIYEDSINEEDVNQQYVRYSDFKTWEESLGKKALKSDLEYEKTRIDQLEVSIKNYSTTSDIEAKYAPITYVNDLLDLESDESFIRTNFYTKAQADSKFVTIESLKGETSETDYIFVTQTQYKKDQDIINEELNATLKTEEDGSVKNLTVEAITSSKESLDIKTKELYVNSQKVAIVPQVPNIVSLEQTDFDKLKESGSLSQDTYYFTYSDNQKDGVVTNELLEGSYYNKAQVNQAIYNAIIPLMRRIAKLEGTSSYLDLGELDFIKLG